MNMPRAGIATIFPHGVTRFCRGLDIGGLSRSIFVMEIIDCPSPNFNPRRHGGPPDMVVLHYTAMHSAKASLDRLCAPEHEVSAHWLIAEDGRTYRLVDEAERAWHAGRGAWGDVTDVNSHSVGIELQNPGAQPFPDAQMIALERLLGKVMDRWSIAPQRVIAHSDMAPDRKSDPGARFDWRRLALGGLSVWPDQAVEPEASIPGNADDLFLRSAELFGYRGKPGPVLDAFRQRFRPWAMGGPIDAADLAAISDLARNYPVAGPVA